MILNFKSLKDQWQHYGKHYGYPQCCINSFCDETVTRSQRAAGNKTGFIPCKHHTNLILSGKVTLQSLIKQPPPVEID